MNLPWVPSLILIPHIWPQHAVRPDQDQPDESPLKRKRPEILGHIIKRMKKNSWKGSHTLTIFTATVYYTPLLPFIMLNGLCGWGLESWGLSVKAILHAGISTMFVHKKAFECVTACPTDNTADTLVTLLPAVIQTYSTISQYRPSATQLQYTYLY